jgi:tRNA-splicing ligase RtcB
MMYDLKRVGDAVYEIAMNESTGMKVPVRVYANKYIFEHMQRDRTLMQAVNASMLPSITGSMLVMPDGHEGYGFPVGGVAAFDADNGIVSPGAIGFDINCLHPDTKIYCDDGAYFRIAEAEFHSLDTFDKVDKVKSSAAPLLFMKKKFDGELFKIKTRLGKQILVTGDHPLMTQHGMVNATDLTAKDKVLITGYEGMEYVKPSPTLIVDEDGIRKAMHALGIKDNDNACSQAINFLRSVDLLEIRCDSEKLSILLKLFGIVLGDGTLPYGKHGILPMQIYGKKKDLETIKRDLGKLGINCNIYHRLRKHNIHTQYGNPKFDFDEYSLHVTSKAFSVVLAALGCPVGNKSTTEYRIPDWLMNSEKWQKRLFLAAYFGAELSTPRYNNDQNISELAFSVNKRESIRENALQFVSDIKSMLSSLDISTSEPAWVEGYKYAGKHSHTIGLRLSILSNTENMERFLKTVGYAYNTEKERLASLSALYISYLKGVRKRLAETRSKVMELQKAAVPSKRIIIRLSGNGISTSFVEHTLWGRDSAPRAYGVEKFKEFCAINEAGSSGFIYDDIASIENVEYRGYVFDISMDDKNHDFIANSMVVSNCGVRLVKTNLSETDVRPKLNPLMDALFKNVPSGVGSKINLGFTDQDLENVATEGVGYIIGKGYGWKEDADRTEENGAIAGADSSKVSKTAKSRGKQQLGTLGAGNHFLEVQKVEKIFDEKLAEAYGLHTNQIVVMLHSGSRGYGHQVCSDYLDTLSTYQAKNNIKLPDPELAYAYLDSKEAQDYLGAMRSAVNFAFANRQIMMSSIRKSFEDVFARSSDSMGMDLLYDVAHNIAKLEEHTVEGKRKRLIVHRKGATRAFAPGRQEVPKVYRAYGQPVIIPGSMGTASYILAGREEAMQETFGSSCHGSGRLMSRHQAIRDIPMSQTLSELDAKHIAVRVRSKKLISEEAMEAYKNVDDVVATISEAKISNIVARLVPIGVAKG